MILYYKTKIFIHPLVIKIFLTIVLYLDIGNHHISRIQYEKIYHTFPSKISYINYYIFIENNTSRIIKKNKYKCGLKYLSSFNRSFNI